MCVSTQALGTWRKWASISTSREKQQAQAASLSVPVCARGALAAGLRLDKFKLLPGGGEAGGSGGEVGRAFPGTPPAFAAVSLALSLGP